MIRCPSSFNPTHETSGLPGFPAVDLFGSARELVAAGWWGKVSKISGRDPSFGGRPGGPYGRSVYITNALNGQVRYLTHLDELAVQIGDVIRPGQIIGTLCDSKVSGKIGTTHVHLGHKR